MAVAVIISGFGALNGWTMICAEMPLAAADDGLFPQRFKRISKNGVPAFGIVASTVLASVAMIINYLGSNGPTVFTTLVRSTSAWSCGANARHRGRRRYSPTWAGSFSAGSSPGPPSTLGMLQRLLDTTSLSGRQWVVVLALSLIAPAFVGVDKAIQLRRQRQASQTISSPATS